MGSYGGLKERAGGLQKYPRRWDAQELPHGRLPCRPSSGLLLSTEKQSLEGLATSGYFWEGLGRPESSCPHVHLGPSAMPTITAKPQPCSSAPVGPGQGRWTGVGAAGRAHKLPCGMAGLAFFAGATSSALDSEKDAVLLGAGVWGGIRRQSKNHG